MYVRCITKKQKKHFYSEYLTQAAAAGANAPAQALENAFLSTFFFPERTSLPVSDGTASKKKSCKS